MSEDVKLGKIKKVFFGFGGYQNVQVVYSFILEGQGWGTISVFECGWGHVSEEDLNKTDYRYKWTHESRIKQIGENGWKVIQILKDAKVSTLDELKDKPVRVYFNGMQLDRWEILKEVL
jgi:hypothetical protein